MQNAVSPTACSPSFVSGPSVVTSYPGRMGRAGKEKDSEILGGRKTDDDFLKVMQRKNL